MLSSILRFHHGSDYVLLSLLDFLSPSCLETQTELATKRLFVSEIKFFASVKTSLYYL